MIIPKGQNHPYVITAESGTYQNTSKIIDLVGHVKLTGDAESLAERFNTKKAKPSEYQPFPRKKMTKALKWIYILTIVLTFSLLMPSILLSKEEKKKDPLEITSDRMRSEDGGIKIIFSGNVVATKRGPENNFGHYGNL